MVTLSPPQCCSRLLLLTQAQGTISLNTQSGLAVQGSKLVLLIFKIPQGLVTNVSCLKTPLHLIDKQERREFRISSRSSSRRVFSCPPMIFSPHWGLKEEEINTHFQCASENLQGNFTCRCCRTENIYLK